jgi:hypothetical protein
MEIDILSVLLLIVSNIAYFLPLGKAWRLELYRLVSIFMALILASSFHHFCFDGHFCIEELRFVTATLDIVLAYLAIAEVVLFIVNYDLIYMHSHMAKKTGAAPGSPLPVTVERQLSASSAWVSIVSTAHLSGDADEEIGASAMRRPLIAADVEHERRDTNADDDDKAQPKLGQGTSRRPVLVRHTYAEVAHTVYLVAILFCVLFFGQTFVTSLVLLGIGLLVVGASFALYWRMKLRTLHERFNWLFMGIGTFFSVSSVATFVFEGSIGRALAHPLWHIQGALSAYFLLAGASNHLREIYWHCCS